MKQENLDITTKEGIQNFLQNPSLKIAETITGILTSSLRDVKLSTGKLVQAALKNTLLTELGKEIEKYQKAGRIKEDYFATNRNRASLYELLKFLDENVPDDELFRAIKSIFFSGIDIRATEKDEILAYEFLDTVKKMNGTEILILKANFEIINVEHSQDPDMTKRLALAQSKRNVWRAVVASQMGYGNMDSVVLKYELNLENLGLISPRAVVADFQNDCEPTNRLRLTELGYKFCQFISNFE